MTDEIVGLLRSLPPDLPQPADRVQRVQARAVGRRRRLAVAVTVLAVVAVTVPLSVLLTGGPAPVGTPLTGRPAPVGTPLTCPQAHAGTAPWVPAPPRGIDGRDRLVPPQPPTHALVCAYHGDTSGPQAGWALTGSRQLAGGLDQLALDLTLVARRTVAVGCPAVGGRQVNYLLGLSYDGGTLWVSATDDPGTCIAASNGQFTAGNLGEAVAASYAAGTWPRPAPPAGQPCSVQSVGRLGQDTALVPPSPVSVDICQDPGPRAVTLTTGFTGLVDALNQLPTQAAAAQCYPGANQPAHYRLVFRYAQGPSVLIHVLVGCQPAILNGSLAAVDATPIVPHIEQLLAGG